MKPRSHGREFYTHKPAFSPTGGLPPLSYSLTTPRDSGHDRSIITPAADSSVLNQSLEVLASRIGSIQQLPELHVLIQDTVNSTLRGIKGVIEAQVNRQLETDKLGIVEEMVSRLLTEEVIKITHQSAQALTRREVEHISNNQMQLQESVTAAEQVWKRRFEGEEKMRLELDSRVRELAARYEKSLQRVEETEMGLMRLRAAIPSADEIKDQIAKLSEKIDKARIREDEHVRDLSQVEERCQGLYTTKVEFSELVKRTDDISILQESHGEKWLAEALKPYAVSEVVTQNFSKAEDQCSEAVSMLRESLTRDVDELRRSTFATTRELGEIKSSKQETLALHEESSKARASLEVILRRELEEVKTAIYAHIDEAVEAQHSEREKLSDTFHVAQNEVHAESAELHSLLGVAREEIEKHHDRFESLISDVAKLGADITSLSEQHAKIREGFTDEKMRCEAIFSQQQHNRTELNFMIQRTHDVELLRADIKTCQASVEEHTERIQVLGQEVSQWEHAIEAQQVLRKETAQLRDGVEKNRQAMENITQQQMVGINNLRSLHENWLQGNAERSSA